MVASILSVLVRIMKSELLFIFILYITNGDATRLNTFNIENSNIETTSTINIDISVTIERVVNVTVIYKYKFEGNFLVFHNKTT